MWPLRSEHKEMTQHAAIAVTNGVGKTGYFFQGTQCQVSRSFSLLSHKDA